MDLGDRFTTIQVNNLLVGAYKNGAQKALFKISILLHPEDRKYSSSANQGDVSIFNPLVLGRFAPFWVFCTREQPVQWEMGIFHLKTVSTAKKCPN